MREINTRKSGKAKSLTVVKQFKNGRKVTSKTLNVNMKIRIPAGIYLANKNVDNITFAVDFMLNGTRHYLGTYNSLNKAKRAKTTYMKTLGS
jgi:hypothetical protein